MIFCVQEARMTVLIIISIVWLLLEASVLFQPDHDREWIRVIYAGLPGWMEVAPKGVKPGDDFTPMVAGPAAWAAGVAFNGYFGIYRGPWIWGFIQWLRHM